MQKLDLHGIRHHNVDDRVRVFLNFAELPCEIITGNSSDMKKLVKSIVQSYGWRCHEKNSYNFGTLIIMEK